MTGNEGNQSNFLSIMPRRLVSKDAAALPHHHQEENSALSSSINDKKSLNYEKFHKNKTPSFRALSVIIFFRQSFRDFSFSKIIFLFLCTALLLITANDSSPILRRLASAKSHYSFDKPRIIQVNTNLDHLETKQYLETYQPGLSTQEIYVSGLAGEARKLLKNSKKYGQWSRDPLKEGDCEPMHWWQETSFPSCNKMHEMHMEKQFQFLADGGYNSVFSLRDIDRSMHVVKILQYDTDHTDRNFDRVRRDSLIMERSTRSPYVVDIHSFCGFAQVVEFGKDGNLDDVVWNHYDDLSSSQKLQIATQVAQALADVHNMDGDGRSSMSHGDFATKQYILINGHLKLSDFNRGRFIRWNPKKKESCPYTIGSNDGKFRAPEEYNYIPETAAIDVWALGSIFVELLTGHGPWHGYDLKKAQNLIAKGNLPPLADEIKNSSYPVDQVLQKAIELCYVFEPKDRPKAGVVVDFLKTEAEKLGIDWHAPFEVDE